MKTNICFRILITFIVSHTCFVQFASAQTICDSVFMKEYSTSGNLQPATIKNLSTKEILIAGRGTITPTGPSQSMLVKLSQSGSILWSILIGGNNDDQFNGIVELSDGSYIVYGTTKSFGYQQGKILLTHISTNGNILWSRQLGDSPTSNDRIKAMIQYSDGDIVGTFNSNDSTIQSDPIVFKMRIDGTIRWATKFDNMGEESFTTIAFESNKIYVGGFYTDVKRKCVLSTLNSIDGAIISSQNLYHSDSTFNQELTNLEIFNNKISYGIWLRKVVNSFAINKMLLLQSDLAGNKTFQTIMENGEDSGSIYLKRTPDQGFYILRNVYLPEVIKLNGYNTIEWATNQTTANYAYGQKTTGFTFFTDTITQYQKPMIWNSVLPVVPSVNDPVTPTVTSFDITVTSQCDNVYCKDTTPLAEGCNKTSLIEYSNAQATIIRDAITTPDGGRIVIGNMGTSGWVEKLKTNGDVEWSKKMDQFDHIHNFLRVIKSADNNIIAFANNYYIIDHGAFRVLKILKMDNNGNTLLSEDLSRDYFSEIADVTPTPDGGFIIILNQCYGCGYLFLMSLGLMPLYKWYGKKR